MASAPARPSGSRSENLGMDEGTARTRLRSARARYFPYRARKVMRATAACHRPFAADLTKVEQNKTPPGGAPRRGKLRPERGREGPPSLGPTGATLSLKQRAVGSLGDSGTWNFRRVLNLFCAVAGTRQRRTRS